jgi:hypothetical protein
MKATMLALNERATGVLLAANLRACVIAPRSDAPGILAA